LELMYKKALEEASSFELYILARYAHKLGMDMLTDEEYDTLEERIKTFSPYHPLLNENWEEDEEPTELALKYGIVFPDLKKSMSERLIKYSRHLSYQHAISIKPVRDWNEAHCWFDEHIGQELIFMLKIDGIHLTTLTDSNTGNVCCVSSRARDARQMLDYTDAFIKLKNNFNYKKKDKNKNFNITHFECYCTKESLSKLRNIQGAFYKTEKSAALGLMTRGINEFQIPYVKLYALRPEPIFNTLSRDLTYLNLKCNLNIPPFIVKTYNGLNDNNFNGFIEEIQELLICKAKELKIPYDGIVVQINNNEDFYRAEIDNKYSSGNIAIKFGYNTAKKFVVKVKDIKFINSKERLIPKIILYPTVSPDGKKITEISGYNVKTLIANKILPESYVSIKWQSDAIPILDI